MKIAFVSSPKISDKKYASIEECCTSTISSPVLQCTLLSSATMAKLSGHDVSFFDMSIETPDLSSYDLVIFPVDWMNHKKIFAEMGKIVCKNNKVIVISFFAGYAVDLLGACDYLDAVVISEQEQVIGSLPVEIDDIDDWIRTTDGIVHKGNRAGKYIKNRLDELPCIDFSIVPKRYWKLYKNALYQVTRGCPYRCNFCMWGGESCV